MIDMPIVDSHLHLWDPRQLRYPWLQDISQLQKPFLPKDYQLASGTLPIERMVFLQCEVDPAQAMEEVAWVASLATEEPRIHGIVAWAPLEQGVAARPHLESLLETSLVKGIRRIIQFEPDQQFCLQPDFVTGVRMLAEWQLPFDLCISHPQLENTIQLVRQCPDVRFVLDHIGKPDIKQSQLDPWRNQIRKLAELPHVWCKVSGLVVEADMEHWQPADLRPYIDHVLEVFGFDRVMFGSDWPVLIQATDLATWVDTLWSAVAGCSTAEKAKLFHDNAMSFYQLDR